MRLVLGPNNNDDHHHNCFFKCRNSPITGIMNLGAEIHQLELQQAKDAIQICVERPELSL